MDKLIVAFASEEARRRIVRLLESGGCFPSACCRTGGEIIRAVHQLGSAVVVCGFRLRDMTAGELAHALWGEAALLVVSSPANLDLCQGENLFKLPTPVVRSDFFASLELTLGQLNGGSVRRLARRREEEQRLIQRAKELLMEINRMTEAEAHRFLQKRSMDAGLKMAETAQLVIDSYR